MSRSDELNLERILSEIIFLVNEARSISEEIGVTVMAVPLDYEQYNFFNITKCPMKLKVEKVTEIT